MFIDCIDMSDPIVGNAVINWLQSISAVSVQIQFYGMSNALAQMVASITAVATSPIEALRIHGHGYAGGQGVSGGSGVPDPSGAAYARFDADFSGITTSNFTQLAPIAGLFDPGGRVELRGCSVGALPDGAALLLDLASLFNVPAYGAQTINRAGPWAAAVTMATPNGVLASCVGPVVNGNDGPGVPVP